MGHLHKSLLHLENVIHHQLVSHSIVVLRVAVGAVFLGFGVLKYFPGVSPAENLTMATTDLLTFGLVPGGVSIVAIATLECVIGVSLISGRGMRVAIWLLGIQFVGILSPIVLLPDRLFAGLHGAPTLEGQYVLKDVILVAAGMVIAAATFRGGRMVRADLPPAARIRAMAPLDSEQKLRLVLQGAGDPARFAELSERHGIPETEFHDWRAIARGGAERALADAYTSRGDKPRHAQPLNGVPADSASQRDPARGGDPQAADGPAEEAVAPASLSGQVQLPAASAAAIERLLQENDATSEGSRRR